MKRKKNIITFIVVVIALLFSAYFCMNFYYSSMLQHRLDKLRKDGFPTTFKELNDMYPKVPDSENAAIIYQKAAEEYERNETDEFKYPEQLKLDQARNYLKVNKKAIDLFIEGNKRQKCRYPIDFSKGWDCELNSYQIIPSGFNLFSAKIRVNLIDKDINGCIDSILNLELLLDSLAEIPHCVEHFSRNYRMKDSVNMIETLINYSKPTSSQMDRLLPILEEKKELKLLRLGLVGSLVFDINTTPLENVKAIDDMPFSKPPIEERRIAKIVVAIYEKTWFFYKDRSSVIDNLKETIDYCDMSPEILANNINKKFKYSVYPRFIGDPVFCFGVECGRAIDLIALKRIARTCLAIEKYRLKNENIPGALSELVPEYMKKIPLDPYTAKELKYTITKDGYKVYSFGQNCVDDHGTKNEGYYSRKDIVFEIFNEKKKPVFRKYTKQVK
jgi:hypothetical protein